MKRSGLLPRAVARARPWVVAALLATVAPAHAGPAPAQLERGNGPEPSTLDAHRCQEVACGNILRDLYEGLVTEDARGRLVPGIAERWSVSPDGRTWTFTLRPALRWSNGQPLDAPQVVASFRRAFAPMTAAPFAELFDALHNARAVQAGHGLGTSVEIEGGAGGDVEDRRAAEGTGGAEGEDAGKAASKRARTRPAGAAPAPRPKRLPPPASLVAIRSTARACHCWQSAVVRAISWPTV